MACGYQQCLAKCQGNSKSPLGSEKVIFPVIEGGKNSGEAKERVFVTEKILNQIPTFCIYMGMLFWKHLELT